ncbi:MAG: patatin-like phospholipase family protein [Sphaerochaetaceae bacterium]
MGLLQFIRNRIKNYNKEERFILCLDGGGMRGVVSATILKHIDALFKEAGSKEPFYSYFDLISGTSTGGMIALGISAGGIKDGLLYNGVSQVDFKKIVDLYLDYGSIIFPKNQSFLKLSSIGQLFGEKYDDLSFNQLLDDIFGSLTMQEAKVPTMVVTYNLSDDCPYLISSYDNPTLLIKTAARATSAAPTYFSPVKINDPRSKKTLELVDGGVVANNPVLYAYTEAKKLYPNAKKFHILSISTASRAFKVELNKTGSGVIGWLDPSQGAPIYRLYASSQMQTSSFIASSLTDVEYLRVHKELAHHVKLDQTDSESLNYLVKQADEIYLSYKEQLKEYCIKAIRNPKRETNLLPVALESHL